MVDFERLRQSLADRLAVRINADVMVDYRPDRYLFQLSMKKSGLSLAFEVPAIYQTGGAAELMQSIEYRALDLAKKLGWLSQPVPAKQVGWTK